MCGRFALVAPEMELAEHFGLSEIPVMSPRYNIAPTQSLAAVRVAAGAGARRLAFLRWGLVPGWAKDVTIGVKMINARCETVAEKPAFRSAFRARRCLVPASGFFEWTREGSKKVPWFICLRQASLFAIAGLWESWKDPQGKELQSVTLLTTGAGEAMADIHERMPVILRPADYAAWLDPAQRESTPLLSLIRPWDSSDLLKRRVSPVVNSALHDVPECLESISISKE
jgi:putative SOS response-associated peptidase YedK